MSYQTLSDEIDRVTSSPYPSQLRTLRDILAKCHTADIEQWAAAKPCLVDPLVSCLLEALPQWPYVLDIVTRFSRNAACRDAVLRQQPTLLHSVVAHAVSAYDKDKQSKYVRASIALLSMPLPDTVALPAEVQTLFLQLFETATKNPIPSTIEPIYLILSGTGCLLLGLLSDKMLDAFEDEMVKILRNSADNPNGQVGLYCLGIMKMVCESMNPEFRLDNSSYNTQDFLASTPNSSRWRPVGMQEFFVDTKAQKSTQLMALTVMFSTGESAASRPCPERLKAVLHANEIISAIPADLRRIWCQSNLGNVRKIQNRLCEEPDGAIRTVALRFIGKLCEFDTLPHPVLEALETTFTDVKSVQTVHVLCRDVDDSDLLANILARAPISRLLENALEYAIRADSPTLAAGADAVTSMVSNVQTIIGSHKIAGHQVREVLNDSKFLSQLQKLRGLLEQSEDSAGKGSGKGWCHKALHTARCRLAHQISNVLLRASRTTALDPEVMTDLLDLHSASARGISRCSHGHSEVQDVVTFADADDSTTADEHIDWREALKTHFKARAQVEQDAVGTLFAKACANLEARCENVEAPLLEEKLRRQALEQQYGELSRVFEELESRHVDLTVQHRSLKEDLQQQARERDADLDENSRLVERVSQLQHKVHAAEISAKKQLEELRETMNLSELGAAARIAQKQTALEDAQEDAEAWEAKHKDEAARVASLEHGMHNLESKIAQQEKCLSASNDRVQELESAIKTSKRELEQHKSQIELLEHDLESATGLHVSRGQELSELEHQLSECQSDRDTLRNQLGESHKYNEELGTQLRESRSVILQHEESVEELKSKLGNAQEQLREMSNAKETEIASLDHKIADLKKRVERYQRKCEEKDQQIAEANAMRTNLMAAMGINGGQPRASLPHRSRESVVPQTQTHTAGLAQGVDMEDSQQLSQSFISHASSPESRGGPTPKRSRPRKSLSFAAPQTTKRRSSVGLRTSRTSIVERKSVGGSTTRQALASVSGNHRASMPPARTPSKVAFAREEKEPGDETTFEGSELFSGTQGANIVDLQAAFDEES